MKITPKHLPFLLLLFSLLLTTPLHSNETPPASTTQAPNTPSQPSNQFVRFKENDSGAWLQCAMTSYRNANGITVTLIGAVHVGDKNYYQQLNQLFEIHDVVLYEMVGGPIQKRKPTPPPPTTDPNTPPPTTPTPDSAETDAAQRLAWLGPLHERIQKALDLQGQLDGIDYYAPNLVHADMTHTQFAAKQKEHQESFLSLWLKAMKVQIENPQINQSQPGLLKILEIFTRNDSVTELKRIIARSFDSVESLIAGMESGNGTVILTERNKVALNVLKHQINLGKTTPAIFYGAAHLPDMEKRLLHMGYQKINTTWLNAWTLPPEPTFESDKKPSPKSNK